MSEAEKKLLNKVLEIVKNSSQKRWIEAWQGWSITEHEVNYTKPLIKKLLELYY